MTKRKPAVGRHGDNRNRKPGRHSSRQDGRPSGRGGKRRRDDRQDAGAEAPAHGAAAGLWLYGSHAVLAALGNPRRRCRRLLVSREAARTHAAGLAERLQGRPDAPAAESADRSQFEQILPDGAVHQGLALQVEPLPAPALEDLLPAASEHRPVILALDQVTDPRNVGAIMRSAAAFGALAVIAPERHAAPPGGALAKAASGALETLPYVEVKNLARALDSLKAAGFWCLGLAGEAEATLAQADSGGPLVLVLGAEGTGMRRLTRERCDSLARLPTRGPVDSLNVSNAAAVALYQLLAV